MKKEGQMFLYTLVDSLEAVMSVMCRSFGISQIRKTNRLELENGSISMIVTVMCTDMGEEAEERIKEQTGRPVSYTHLDVYKRQKFYW